METRPLSPSTPSGRGMDKYEQLAVVGEGSYGVVLKCRRRDTGQFVAIKKFLETEDDAAVRKMALREIRMLKKLRHDHLVNMIEVFRRKRRFYLVFEYLDHTLLDELEGSPVGLGEETTRRYLYQLLKGIDYCHQNSIIHRDVKPENVLVSNDGVVKLCDFGFARTLAAPGEPCTEYVATRWYRAPELLVSEHRYGTEVDIWAIGCLFAEMLTGEPLFPGDSDIDQLALIGKTVGKLAPRHQVVVSKLPGGAAAAQKPITGRESLPATGAAKDLMAACLRTEPRARPTAAALLRHKYFTADNFVQSFGEELRRILGKKIKIPKGPAKSATKVGAKPRQWTVNDFPDQSRSSTDAPAPADLISYNFDSSADNADKEAKQGNHSKGPCTKTTSVPANNFPRTPHIKKVKNKMFVDEDMMSRVPMPPPLSTHKVTKKAPAPPPPAADFTLPYVSGASHSPMKKAKKPAPPPFGSAAYETWDGAVSCATTFLDKYQHKLFKDKHRTTPKFTPLGVARKKIRYVP